MSKPGKTATNGARAHCRALLFCVAWIGLAAPAQAERAQPADSREASRQQTPRDGAARAAGIAQSRYGGKVLKHPSRDVRP
jgi:hypothetical protein